MKNKLKLTTVALEPNQYLIAKFHGSIVETYCEGYTNNKRDKTLDGYYFTKELKALSPKIKEFNTEYKEVIN